VRHWPDCYDAPPCSGREEEWTTAALATAITHKEPRTQPGTWKKRRDYEGLSQTALFWAFFVRPRAILSMVVHFIIDSMLSLWLMGILHMDCGQLGSCSFTIDIAVSLIP